MDASQSAKSFLASARKRRPSNVKLNLRVDRVIRLTRACSSNCGSATVTVEVETDTWRAAAEKLPVSAIATYRRRAARGCISRKSRKGQPRVAQVSTRQ